MVIDMVVQFGRDQFQFPQSLQSAAALPRSRTIRAAFIHCKLVDDTRLHVNLARIKAAGLQTGWATPEQLSRAALKVLGAKQRK